MHYTRHSIRYHYFSFTTKITQKRFYVAVGMYYKIVFTR